MHDIFNPNNWEDLPATRRVFLTNCGSVFALIDREDWPLVSRFGLWSLHHCGKGKSYARTSVFTNGREDRIYMHRLIANARLKQPRARFEKSPLVDHLDGDGLNNTTANLRWATHVQNVRNRAGSRARARLTASVYSGNQTPPMLL